MPVEKEEGIIFVTEPDWSHEGAAYVCVCMCMVFLYVCVCVNMCVCVCVCAVIPFPSCLLSF